MKSLDFTEIMSTRAYPPCVCYSCSVFVSITYFTMILIHYVLPIACVNKNVVGRKLKMERSFNILYDVFFRGSGDHALPKFLNIIYFNDH